MSCRMLGAPRLCSAPVQRVSSLLVSRRLSIAAPRNAALSDASAAGACSAAPNSGDGVGDMIELGPVTHVKVKTADFVKSSVTLEQCPAPKLPEFAVIGRSNVGKSSLINMLTGKKALALVSKTPGKTKCINHFIINNSWYLVDLPGYGYAKTSKTNRLEWASFTQEYFLNRETLVNVLLLVDSSVPPQKIDLEVVNWLGDSEVPFSIVFTKTDKRKKRAPAPDENMAAFKEKMLEVWEALPACLPCCAVKGDGRVEILHHIAQYRTFFERNTARNR